MNTSTYTQSSYYAQFQEGLSKITESLDNSDSFHLNLYYSSMIAMVEKYLSDLYINEIESDESAFHKMILTDKYKNTSYPLVQIVMGDVKKHVINSVKSLVWHRLNDIDYLYKNTLNIKFNVSEKIREIIATRHDIVHRNGFDINGTAVNINADDVVAAMDVVSKFILDIDKKYHAYKSIPT
ncbi:TPA: hypothetical protein ACKE3U_003740 [Klebsiella aerogenes]